MTGIIAITLIIIVLLIFLYILDPTLDKVIVDGEERRIIWYNSKEGRDWMFL